MLTVSKLIMSKDAAMGIGSLIIFVAMLLVAGIAATTIIQTMNSLQQQSLKTGSETIKDIATGIEITHISGKIDGSNITQIAIFISTVLSSNEIDINRAHIALADPNKQVILFYDSNYYNNSLSNGLFDSLDLTNLDSSSFGIIVIKDADDSCTVNSPIINEEDIVVLMVNASSCFGSGSSTSGMGTRIEVTGGIYPETGIRGVISFITPSAFTDNIIDLQ
jgi:flagellin FlaB